MSLCLTNISPAASHPIFINTPAPENNHAEKALLLYLNILMSDNAFLPLAKNQALGKAAGKTVVTRLQAYEKITGLQENVFRQALATQQRKYQQRAIAQWHATRTHKKNGIGAA